MLPADFATKDTLQTLSDGHAFLEDVRRRVEQHYRYEAPVSILYCGVDGLAQIVSKHGAEAGLVVLRAVAQFLRGVLRDHDAPSRISADCFAIMLAGLEANEAVGKAERIRQAVERCKLPIDGLSEIRLTTSLGVAEIEPGNDAEVLVRRGMLAYTAANRAGNIVVVERNGSCNGASADVPAGAIG